MGSSIVTHHTIGSASGSSVASGPVRYISIRNTGYAHGDNIITTLDADYDWVILHSIRRQNNANTVTADIILVENGVVNTIERFMYVYYSSRGDTYVTYSYSNREVHVNFSSENYSPYTLGWMNHATYLTVA